MKDKPKPKPILDNYSFQELDSTFKGFESLKRVYGLAKIFGYNNPDLNETFKKMDEEKNKYKRMKEVLYKFNELFANRGWMAFESLNLELMEKCVELAEEKDIEEAENRLIQYYCNREEIDFLIRHLLYFKDFQPRKEVFLKALEDHFNKRYHSSVPIFLMMIDGLVSDVKQKSFFTESIDVTVWDTIVGHDSNLGEIQSILNKGRRKTTKEKIDLPYRHGILHGRDLGYDNQVVSAKSLAILLSLRDWVDAIREGKSQEEKEYTTPTLKESFDQIKESWKQHEEIKKQREYMDKDWKPRQIIIGSDLPSNGDIESYEEGTPERKLMKFLSFLTKNNYGKLAMYITNLSKQEESIGKLAGELRKVFEGKQLKDYELVNIIDKGAALTVIETKLEFTNDQGNSIIDNRVFRLIYQDNQSNTLIRGYHDGEWKIFFNFANIEFLELNN